MPTTGLAIRGGKLLREAGKLNVAEQTAGCASCCGPAANTCEPCNKCCWWSATQVTIPSWSWMDFSRAGWSAADIAFFDATQNRATDLVLTYSHCRVSGIAELATFVGEETIAGIRVGFEAFFSGTYWLLACFDLDDPTQFRSWMTRLGLFGGDCCWQPAQAGQYVEYNGDFGSFNVFSLDIGEWTVANNKCCKCEAAETDAVNCIISTKDYCPDDADNVCDQEADIDLCEALP